MPWVSQGVLLGATGATGSTGPTGPTGGQSTTTTASFTMPALNAAVTIAVTAAAWTKLGQTLWISDGTNIGWWEITTRTSTTSIAITNRGYVGTPASGTMATAAVVQLQGPGIATQTVPGLSPFLAAQTTAASFVCPALGSVVTITTPSCTWTIGGTLLWISDGTRMGFFQIATRFSATSLSIQNVSYVNGLASGTFSANSAVTFAGPGYAASGSPGLMPPWDAAYFTMSGANLTLNGSFPHGPTHLSSDPTGGTSHYYAAEEFVSPPTLGAVGNSGGAGAVSSIYQGLLPAAHVGALQLQPGTATGQYARYFLNPTALQTGFSMTLRSIIEVVSALTSAEVFFGLSDQPGPILDTSHNYIGFFFQPSFSANWSTVVRAAASVTGPTSTGTAAISAWVDLKMTITPSSIGFYVNGALFSTISTTIPAASAVLLPCIFIASNTVTSNPQILIDTFEIDIDSGTAGKFMKAAI